MQLTKCESSIKGAVESVHLWISLVDGAVIINLMKNRPHDQLSSRSTRLDIFALNEPLKRYADVIIAGVKPPALVFKSPQAFWRGIQRYRGKGGKLTTDSLMWYVLDRRLTRERILSSAMLKSQTVWQIKGKISANLSEKEKEVI